MSDNTFSHQDWKPVVINRKSTPTTITNDTGRSSNETNKSSIVTSRSTGPNKNDAMLPRKVVKDFDPENMTKPTTSNLELSKAIQTARCAKNMKQTDLDNACSFPKNTVRDYENGSAKINHAQINKMITVLGVTLPRPK